MYAKNICTRRLTDRVSTGFTQADLRRLMYAVVNDRFVVTRAVTTIQGDIFFLSSGEFTIWNSFHYF